MAQAPAMWDVIEAATLAIFRALTRRFEGRRLRPYLCPAGVPTIGEGSTHYEDGRPVKLGDPPITAERAETLAERDRKAFLRAALAYSPNLVNDPPRAAAVADFIYNLGPARYATSTLRRKVREGDWPAAAEQLNKWIWGGGRKLPGLVTRRAAEARLVNAGA